MTLVDHQRNRMVVDMPRVYILRCSDGTLYVGHTDDLNERERAHNAGCGSRYTAARLPVRVIYSEMHGSSQRAISRERQLKRWSAEKKEALIAGDLGTLKRLSRCRRTRARRRVTECDVRAGLPK